MLYIMLYFFYVMSCHVMSCHVMSCHVFSCYFFILVSDFVFLSYSALVWGSSVKHNPQKVGKEHILQDEDVVQIVKRFV